MKPGSVIKHVFESHYCKIVFVTGLFIGYLSVPKSSFFGWLGLFAVVFIGLFALTLTCLIRNIKERIKLVKSYQNSILGIIASSLGIIALQVCGSNGLFCGVGLFSSIFSSLIPHFLFSFFENYGIFVLILSILIQIYSLQKMSCLQLKFVFKANK